MTQVAPSQVVEAPPLSAPANGLLRAAPIRELDPGQTRWLGGVTWNPESCADVRLIELCDTGAKDLSSTKAGNGVAIPFSVEADDYCSTFGMPESERKARAIRSLQAKESAAVENEFWSGGLIGANYHLANEDVDEVQIVTIDATGGTFTLTFDGQTTAAIAWDAAAAAVESALEALSNLAPADVGVSGSAGGPYTVTFTGAYAGQDVDALTADDSSLTGGAQTAVVTTDTVGVDSADVITSGAVTPAEALALVDQGLADAFVGRGMIHARPYIVNKWMQENLLLDRNGQLQTISGHLVVVGQGYLGTAPDGTAPTANSEWIYGTDMVGILRNPTITVLPDSAAEAVNRSTNEQIYTAFREYALLWSQCVWLAAEVDPTP